MNALLPGGIFASNGLRRDYSFRTINGEVELALAESSGLANISDAVTHSLSAALDHIGGLDASVEVIADLSVGDRQFLMRQLNLCLGNDANWYSASCSQCHVDFDFHLELSKMPVKLAGDSYPYVRVQTSQGLCCFRIPNGSDQSVLSQFNDEEQSCSELIRRCLISVDGAAAEIEVAFSDSDKEIIEDAMEAVAPEVGCEVSVSCVSCNAANTISLNPYALIGTLGRKVLSDIHKIASHYHWSEQEILSMSRQRRFMYLSMIGDADGASSDNPAGVM